MIYYYRKKIFDLTLKVESWNQTSPELSSLKIFKERVFSHNGKDRLDMVGWAESSVYALIRIHWIPMRNLDGVPFFLISLFDKLLAWYLDQLYLFLKKTDIQETQYYYSSEF